MNTRIWAAALIACAASGTQAALSVPDFGTLTPGDYTVSIPGFTGTSSFSYQLAFGVAQDSVLTGNLTGISSGASTFNQVRFNESTGAMDTTQVSRQVVFEGRDFNLGTVGASLPGISPSSFVLKLSGSLTEAAAMAGGATLTLTVRAVPEPGTWALMGLGLVGLFVAGRRRAR